MIGLVRIIVRGFVETTKPTVEIVDERAAN